MVGKSDKSKSNKNSNNNNDNMTDDSSSMGRGGGSGSGPITNNNAITNSNIHNHSKELENAVDAMWQKAMHEIQSADPKKKEYWKIQALPLARIKKIMKIEEFVLHELEKDQVKQQQQQQQNQSDDNGSNSNDSNAGGGMGIDNRNENDTNVNNPINNTNKGNNEGGSNVKFMISSEAPVLVTKACELFIQELSTRAWVHTDKNRRRTLQRSDVYSAVNECETFDFLIDFVPRSGVSTTATTTSTTTNHTSTTTAASAAVTGIPEPMSYMTETGASSSLNQPMVSNTAFSATNGSNASGFFQAQHQQQQLHQIHPPQAFVNTPAIYMTNTAQQVSAESQSQHQRSHTNNQYHSVSTAASSSSSPSDDACQTIPTNNQQLLGLSQQQQRQHQPDSTAQYTVPVTGTAPHNTYMTQPQQQQQILGLPPQNTVQAPVRKNESSAAAVDPFLLYQQHEQQQQYNAIDNHLHLPANT